jgi:hypothetical protein
VSSGAVSPRQTGAKYLLFSFVTSV